jgi:hypothetical protein
MAPGGSATAAAPLVRIRRKEESVEKTDPALEAAKAHLKAVRDFMYHLMVFIFVCGLLVILDVRAGTNSGAVLGLDWAYWVILFWGIGVGGHAIWAFLGDHRLR